MIRHYPLIALSGFGKKMGLLQELYVYNKLYFIFLWPHKENEKDISAQQNYFKMKDAWEVSKIGNKSQTDF